MTDAQFPPPPPHGAVPPVPPAPAPGADAAGGHPTAPVFPAAAQPAPQYPAPPQAQQYPVPPGAYAAPAGGYGAQVGGYAPPAGGYQPPAVRTPGSPTLGIIGFVLSLVAMILAPILGGISGYQIGFSLPAVAESLDPTTSDLGSLSSVRGQVLIGEIGFWVGTAAGIAAIVVGIIAMVKRQGRAWGVVALILGVIAPVVFFFVLSILLATGASAGSVSYYGA